ncbi:MAG: filamentous hemagglutinin N-terminal domain-containing protein [Methylomonas sp.]|nr:filamentous hemagglutinin N-terminal domain-containing protein [Methylomonas sp.]
MALADGIATDGSMGVAQALSGSYIEIPQNLGTTVGSNLFHSFSTFNIATGQTVDFTGSDALQNVISRVTGPAPSEIDGSLRSSIPNADFYFINPHGVSFGPNASFDVPGSFHVSTADKIDFQNNSGTFYADISQNSTLSSEPPAAFGFLGTSTENNGLIAINGANVAVKPGQTLEISAGELLVNSSPNQYAYLKASGGEIRLLAVGNDREEVPINGLASFARGFMAIDSSTLNVSGNGAGNLVLQGGVIIVNWSDLFANNTGEIDAGNLPRVNILAENLVIDNNTKIAAGAENSGSAASINISADNIDIDNSSYIRSEAWSHGDAGNIAIKTTNGDLTLKNDSYIGSDTLYDENFNPAHGHAGQITIESSGTLRLLGGADITTQSINSYGNAGSITIRANALQLDGQDANNSTEISTEAYTGITAQEAVDTNGKAGDIVIRVNEGMEILNGGNISASSNSLRNSGNITVEAAALRIDGELTGIDSEGFDNQNISQISIAITGPVEIVNGGAINSNTHGMGQGGDIVVDAGSMVIDSGYSDRSSGISSNTTGTGNSGNISIASGGKIAVLNKGEITTDTIDAGDAGNIKIIANSLKLDGTGSPFLENRGISTDSLFASGHAGDISIESKGLLEILNGASISSSNGSGLNDAGNLIIKAGAIKISGEEKPFTTGIFSNSSGERGNAGSISTTVTQGIDIVNGQINTNTAGTGTSGSIDIDASTLTLNNAKIWAEAYPTSTGHTGNVNITATDSVKLSSQSKISLENAAVVESPINVLPGSVSVSSRDIDLKDSYITTTSRGNVDAGHVRIDFSHWLTMDPSFVSTAANTGNGGTIIVNGGELIYLTDSGFVTTVQNAFGNGGNINVTSDILVMTNGIVQANAASGNGGDISSKVAALIPSSSTLLLGGTTPILWLPFSGLNVIQAASQTGIAGTVNVTSPQLNLSGILANLGTPQFDFNELDQDYCELGLDSSLTRKGAGGLLPKSSDPIPFY